MAAKEEQAGEPEDDYDIVPHKRLVELEQEVDVLKKNPFGATPSGKEMLEGMGSLGKGIKELVGLFRDAADEMKKEQEDFGTFEKQMAPVMERLNDLIEQNKKIARGIIAVADMLKEQGDKIGRMSGGSSFSMPGLPPSPEAPFKSIRPLPPEEMPPPSDFPPPPGGMGRMPIGGPEEFGRMSPPKLMGMPSRPMPPPLSTEAMLMQKRPEKKGFFG